MTTDRLDAFEENRTRMFSLAYRMLGEAAEAEDVVQDAYLRWAASGPVDVPAAWLTRVVTNLCLNRLTSARARRERYVGPWLPEPVFTEGGRLGPLETAEQREAVSLGMLVLLERLTPAERAVFVLREAFGYPHAEIAEVLETGEARVRQLYRRARQHVAEERRRFTAEPGRHEEIVRRFLAAAAAGDVAELERLLAKDVTAWGDGGGVVSAGRRPVHGADKVARLVAGLLRHPLAPRMAFGIEHVNGEPAVVTRLEGALFAVVCLDVTEEGRVAAVRSVVNPAKLAFAEGQAEGRGGQGEGQV
ncbi:RNA polymerase sigma-70 factor [Streptomyces sp. DSM 44917]|uniref:RNA polymerase sigma-70 factor n=1 Tax=Streptomyces boetiae TaxID=3075541 RepID=A0ABU2LEF7_9ACTN|nr:RNA polymerase sigma-70 factor [Streptomyces sp. DSM 44917]MDT0309954.1 RNA polymerase sigma-70 factor [Streptomyces sp. DSM 44917]